MADGCSGARATPCWEVARPEDSSAAVAVVGEAASPAVVVAGPVVRKGSGPEDGYSGFSVLDLTTGTTNATELAGLLNAQGVTEVTVVGLAGDWCVKATAIDAANLGYATTVPLTLTRFVELNPGDADRAVAEMKAAGVTVLD